MKNNIKEIIEESGHELENKTVSILKKEGWISLYPSYYTDKITSKTREADIIAKKEFSISNSQNLENIHKENKILIKLFISCKFIKNEIIFGFSEKDITKTMELVKKQLSLNEEGLKIDESFLQFHHYNKEKKCSEKE